MTNIFNKISRLSKSGLRFLYLNIRYIKLNYTIKDKKCKYAIINFDHHLKGDDLSRYFFTIPLYLKYAGFNIIIKAQWRDFKTFKKPLDFKRLLLKQDYVFVRSCPAPLNTILIVQPNTANHIIYLTYGFKLANAYNSLIQSRQADCIAPYPMHPDQSKLYLEPTFLSILRETNRIIKIFFAGDTDKRIYHKVKSFFNVATRNEIIEYIETHFDKSIILKNESDKIKLNQLLHSKNYINEVIISEVKTGKNDWLKALSKTDFFICPPGVAMPWCHNCVEAMSVGAIPILQYNNLFYPPLENMNNCISYQTMEEFDIAIKKALAMDASAVENMRKNVLDYYDKYLSIHSIVKKIKKFSNSSQLELKVAVPFIMTKEEYITYKSLN